MWTREWWERASQSWTLRISDLVLEEDALHVALATVSAAHYLVTWNFAHLVGPDTKLKLLDILRTCGYCPPLLTTPEELLEIMT